MGGEGGQWLGEGKIARGQSVRGWEERAMGLGMREERAVGMRGWWCELDAWSCEGFMGGWMGCGRGLSYEGLPPEVGAFNFFMHHGPFIIWRIWRQFEFQRGWCNTRGEGFEGL